ncbi:alpha/beta hydrolase [Rhizosphaericola mali]|uniref:Alpha/beta hydrolase n=1 Tax=Rhizosphaericola mali TaxID=2545455 RepID=A0A5P2FYC4_9BACT|nr:alpha/beta hydrolase [Rhizosphaericola mali]QES87937.1 alpha/beta hydrolase [Rhizosphaericola mali]
MSTKLNIVLVHGAFGDGSHWKYVIPTLVANGYNVRAVQLPLTSLDEDVQRTSDMVSSLEGSTLLVGHSYGGMVITQSGNLPSVKGLVYIAAFAPESGESAGGLLQLREAPEGAAAIAPGPSGYLYVNYDKYHDVFCQGVSEDDAIVMSLSQKPITGAAFGAPSGEPAWKNKPSWYQVSNNDKMIPPATETFFAERIKAQKTIFLDAGHASMASNANEVTALILEAAASLTE